MAAKKSTKDKQMAADLKRRGVERTTGRCVICYKIIGNGRGADNHYRLHA
jgi:hypothetical protein